MSGDGRRGCSGAPQTELGTSLPAAVAGPRLRLGSQSGARGARRRRGARGPPRRQPSGEPRAPRKAREQRPVAPPPPRRASLPPDALPHGSALRGEGAKSGEATCQPRRGGGRPREPRVPPWSRRRRAQPAPRSPGRAPPLRASPWGGGSAASRCFPGRSSACQTKLSISRVPAHRATSPAPPDGRRYFIFYFFWAFSNLRFPP